MICPAFFDATYLETVEATLATYIREIVPTLPPERVFFEEGGRSIKSMNRMDEYDAFFAGFKRHPRFLQLTAAVLGTNSLVVENLQFFGKPAHDGSVTPWHQDNGFQNYSPPESVMLWLALDDVTEENGCVTFAAGSHKFGVRPHRPSGVLGFSMGADPPSEAECPRRPAVMSRGSLSMHHCDTFHSSGQNRSNRHRRALAVNIRSSRAVADMAARARIKEEVGRLIRR